MNFLKMTAARTRLLFVQTFGRLTCALLLIGLLSHVSDYTGQLLAQVERKMDCIARIEPLVSKNKAPQLIDEGGKVRVMPGESFDWTEQNRVFKNLTMIASKMDEEAWECILANSSDERYALTMRDNSPIARNYTVGDLCLVLCSTHVLFPSAKYSEPGIDGRVQRINLGIENLAKWRESHANLTLYELQIEACKLALEKVEESRSLEKEAKKEMAKKITADIESLRASKRPFMPSIKLDHFEPVSTKK